MSVSLSVLIDGPISADGRAAIERIVAREAEMQVAGGSFQDRVQPWLLACFGEMIAGDHEERNYRCLEEALELVQAYGSRLARRTSWSTMSLVVRSATPLRRSAARW
jgi:hypothetical protein